MNDASVLERFVVWRPCAISVALLKPCCECVKGRKWWWQWSVKVILRECRCEVSQSECDLIGAKSIRSKAWS